jgi:N-acetylglucosamine-6-phosphate deacetylase
MKAKGMDRIIGVSDSTLAAGLPTGTTVSMWGLDCVVGDGQIRLASNGSLAGSAVTLDKVFANLLTDFGAEVAIKATSLNPRRILKITGTPKVWLKTDASGRILDRLRLDA